VRNSSIPFSLLPIFLRGMNLPSCGNHAVAGRRWQGALLTAKWPENRQQHQVDPDFEGLQGWRARARFAARSKPC
jgi:hypothetical protein